MDGVSYRHFDAGVESSALTILDRGIYDTFFSELKNQIIADFELKLQNRSHKALFNLID